VSEFTNKREFENVVIVREEITYIFTSFNFFPCVLMFLLHMILKMSL